MDAVDVGKRGNLGESRHYDDDALLQSNQKDGEQSTHGPRETNRARFENRLNLDAKELEEERFESRQSLQSSHNDLTHMTSA